MLEKIKITWHNFELYSGYDRTLLSKLLELLTSDSVLMERNIFLIGQFLPLLGDHLLQSGQCFTLKISRVRPMGPISQIYCKTFLVVNLGMRSFELTHRDRITIFYGFYSFLWPVLSSLVSFLLKTRSISLVLAENRKH